MQSPPSIVPVFFIFQYNLWLLTMGPSAGVCMILRYRTRVLPVQLIFFPLSTLLLVVLCCRSPFVNNWWSLSGKILITGPPPGALAWPMDLSAGGTMVWLFFLRLLLPSLAVVGFSVVFTLHFIVLVFVIHDLR